MNDTIFNPALPKTALVTGGAQRIGRELCLALARNGFNVAIHFHQSEAAAEQLAQEIRAMGACACTLQADLNQPEAVTQLIGKATNALSTLGVLVNNASLFVYDAITQTQALDAQLSEQHWRINTLAPVLLTQQFAQQLPEAHHGVVVNILDQKLSNPNPDFLSYTLSKAALSQATILCAQVLAPRIRVMGIAPGLSLPSGEQTAQNFAEKHQQTLLQRGSTPADIAQALIFILTAHSMTGSTLLIDGGQHLTPSPRDVMFL